VCDATAVTWRQVDRAELLRVSADDPFVRFATTSEVVAVAGPEGWACVGPWRPGSGHWGGAALSTPWASERAETDALAALAPALQDRGASLEWFSTRDGRGLLPPSDYLAQGSGRWDFLWTEVVPELGDPGAAVELVELDDRDDALDLGRFGRTHNPEFEGFPGRGFATLWLGARDAAGRLLGIGAVHRLATGIPHLSGIVVHGAHRGRGVGRLLTVELTRRAIHEAGVATLGVYSSNGQALRLYDQLGYRTAHRFHTRVLARQAVEV
jgi:ribosomal protein S18 acetylase RimI-like enzyme